MTQTIEFNTTRVFKETLYAWVKKFHRCAHSGGTSSSKTYSILQFLAYLAEKTEEKLMISLVSESLPHMKRGAMRDFFNIIGESPDNNPYFSKTEMVYKRAGWKGTLEFFGADDSGKVHGPRRHVLFINEANNIPWETARALDIRTSIFTILDWNPVSEFWAYQYEVDGEKYPGWIHEEDTHFVQSTYLDALDVLPELVVKNIESNRDKDPNWWRVYGLGELGDIEGLIHPNFEVVEELPGGDYVFGLDFGYSDDPTVLTKNVIIGDKLYSEELIYERGLTNDEICRRMDSLGVKQNYDEIIADAAEPKSIEEIYKKGYNIKPCEKGKGSVDFGIQKVNQFYQHWTKRSTNCIKEQRNYRWVKDKEGKNTKKPTHVWSHGMDSRRYAVGTLRPRKTKPQSKGAAVM